MNYYKLTHQGFRSILGHEVQLPPRAYFQEISPSLLDHTMRLAEAVVCVVHASYAARVSIIRFMQEGELALPVGNDQVQPDSFFRLRSAGRSFNLAFEIDRSSESLDSHALNAIRRKLTLYGAYQDSVLDQWLAAGKTWERPRLRVIFLTRSVDRAYHILSLARSITRHPSRRLIYAAPQDSFLSDLDPLHAPIFLDHFGQWHSLVDLHPTAPHRRDPVRLPSAMELVNGVC